MQGPLESGYLARLGVNSWPALVNTVACMNCGLDAPPPPSDSEMRTIPPQKGKFKFISVQAMTSYSGK